MSLSGIRGGRLARRKSGLASRLVFGALLLAALSHSAISQATSRTYRFDIRGQDVGAALVKLSKKSGVQILMSKETGKNIQVLPLRGEYTLQQALEIMLSGTGLTYQFFSDKTVVVKPKVVAVVKKQIADKATKQTSEIDETVVTAANRASGVDGTLWGNSLKASSSVVAMDEEELHKGGVNNFVALGLAVPGLSVSDSGNGNGRRIFMRGIGNFVGNTSLIGVYLDELPLTTNPLWQFDMRPYDLERIEVLRGPQGTQFGQSAAGGTIRFISKQPELTQISGRADLSVSYTQDGSNSQQVKGVINLPLIEGELATRVVVMFNDISGWIDQPVANKRNINDENLSDIRIKTLWKPTTELQISTLVNARRNNLGAASVGEDENGDFTQSFGLLSTPWSSDDYEIYNLTVDYEFDELRLLSSSSYISTDKILRDNSFQTAYLPPPELPFESMQDDDINTRVLSQDLRVSSAEEQAWQWLMGAFCEDGRFYRDVFNRLGQEGSTEINSIRRIIDRSYRIFSLYGDSNYRIRQKWTIGVGLRHFVDKREAFDGFVKQTGTFRTLAPRFYLNFDVSDYAILYASASKGFRSGGFNRSTIQIAPFDPETLWSYELGAKLSAFENTLDAEIALFHSQYKNYQINNYILPFEFPAERPETYLSNTGRVNVQGIDWALTWHLSNDLTVSSTGNVVDSEFTRVNPQSSSHAVGDPVDFIPRYSFTLSANYDFYWRDKPGFVRLDYFQKGRATYRNRTAGEHLHASSDVNNMLNFRSNWQKSENFSVEFFVKNILNDRGNLDPWSAIGGAARSRPRTVGLEFGVEF